jgi:hypothetical protein
MTAVVPLWAREPASKSEREAQVLLVVFAQSLRDDVPLSAGRFGIPDKRSAELVDVREHERASAPEWFDGWRSGALRSIAEDDLGSALSDLDAADRCFTLEASLTEPPDLGYLQATWAVARWLVARGATVVLDVHAGRYLRGASLPEPDASFDVRRELNLIFETEPSEPGGGHILHTRGLRKFARPDVVSVCDPKDVELFADIVWQLADGMAQGFLPALPRHGVDVDEDTTLYLVEDEQGAYAELLGLNNDARVLSFEEP